jgi:hypothetical protein
MHASHGIQTHDPSVQVSKTVDVLDCVITVISISLSHVDNTATNFVVHMHVYFKMNLFPTDSVTIYFFVYSD